MAGRILYLVNPAGAIHDCTEQHARERLRYPGWRLATEDEVAQLAAQGGMQAAKKPIGRLTTGGLADDEDDGGDGTPLNGELVNLADGVNEREASTAGKALAARRTTRKDRG